MLSIVDLMDADF